ncbi:MAG: outer membrane lipoprotein carrier protein LolA [Terracidiphilus sp.]|jgi:outer membrane lipoprotein carrier protein
MNFSFGGVGACSRRIAFVCAVLALAGACALLTFGQAPTQVSAHELAARVDRHYDQLHSLKAGFREDYAGLGMTRTESGTLFLRKPGRMLWQYSTPAGKIFLLDGKYAWLYTRGDAQIQRIPSKELDDLRSPLRFLLGHTQLEKELVGLKLEGAANGLYTLSGLPKGQENRVTRLQLTVTAAGAISTLEVQEVDGATTRFTFTGEQPNTAIPAETFHFTPPAGLPVVDTMPPV